MKIILEQAGKKYNRDWIFRKMDAEFSSGNSYAILGPNGSGKSTLLQVLSGFITPSEGNLSYKDVNGKEIEAGDFFSDISFSSPYLEMIEEFTLTELLDFHSGFKNFIGGMSIPELIKLSGLSASSQKQIKYFSSGMKQRVRLSTALLSDVPVVFLDEPLTNLDKSGYQWYRQLIEKYSADRLIIVCSNHQPEEYDFCSTTIDISRYKN